jgi:hypothetical protein
LPHTLENFLCWEFSSVNILTYGRPKLYAKLKIKEKKIASRPECTPKICEIFPKPGNLHDVSCAKEVLAGYAGTVVGDSGCISPPSKILWQKEDTAHCKHR